MTTLIGCRCKSGNIFSRALLIGRGLFLSVSRCESVLRLRRQMQAGWALRLRRRNLWFHSSKKVNRKFIDEYILCNFQRTSWKPRIIGRQQTKVCWWPSKRKPPVPIPNTVVKTYWGEILVARVERVFGFCYKELCSFCKSPPHFARNPQYLEGQG